MLALAFFAVFVVGACTGLLGALWCLTFARQNGEYDCAYDRAAAKAERQQVAY